MFGILRRGGAPFFAIYLIAFLYALHYSLPLYINSSFLEQSLREGTVGVIYALGSLLALFLLPRFPKILSVFGNYAVTLSVFAIVALSLVLLAFSSEIVFIVPLFIFIQILIPLGLFSLDVFAETFSDNAQTGTIRGFLLTVVNIAVLTGAFLAGVILNNGNFWKIYLVAAILLIPAFFVVAKYLKNFKDPGYKEAAFWGTLRDIVLARHPNDPLRHSLTSDFLLRFFYTWMIIYTPIYLNKYVGLPWNEIGVILAIALVPFILFEIPVGKLVDKKIHEKWIMAIGFFIAAFFTATIFFIESASLPLWAVILFGTRVGASFIEIASESYFFKHIGATDTAILSAFRSLGPLAFVMGPLCASVILFFAPIQYLFLALSLILVAGVLNSFLIPEHPKKSI